MKDTKFYNITFRDSTVTFGPYAFKATKLRKAVRKARAWAMSEGYTSWSAYRVESADSSEVVYGPFPYNDKWGNE